MKKLLARIIPLLFLSLGFLFFADVIFAQTPIPELYFPCDKAADPEYHSLRPYQAAPCGDANKALFCGNTLIFAESYKNFPECIKDAPDKDGDFLCKTNKTVPKHQLAVDLQQGELPILGNTQLVKNSQTNKEELDDATKMNEYLSWYLNGVNFRAEYGENDPAKAVDFSGPINKLLPKTISEAQRIRTIQNAVKAENHDQIVVCGKNSFGFIGDIFNIGKVTPIECYKGNNTKAKGDVFRLIEKGGEKGWDKDLSWWNSFVNNIIGKIANLLPSIPRDIIRKSVLNHWNKRIPPLPWENDPFENRPMTNLEYRKYYNEWRGKTCVIVPLINFLVCFDNILVPNKFADLFPYIPLASTADKEAEEKITGVAIAGEGDTLVANTGYGKLTSPMLFYAHTQETETLSRILNTTHTPAGIEGAAVASTENNQCQIVEVRSNPGDYLFPGGKQSSTTPVADTIIADITYTITQVPCEKKTEDTVISIDCEANITVSANLNTQVPFAEEIWKNTVADSNSAFRRIFPKVEEGAPISCVADIPANTAVNYVPVVGNLTKVKNPGNSEAVEPELYFPHLGSVYEYFLKGIQTALRPKGYGEPLTNGQNCEVTICGSGETGEIPDLPGGGSCSLSKTNAGFRSIPPLPPTLKAILEAAGKSFNVPPSLIIGIIFGEGKFNPGKYNWTEANVQEWSKECGQMPNCSPNSWPSTGLIPWLNQNYWNRLKDAVKVVASKREPNPCNLMDSIFALAKNLQQAQNGGGFTINSCFGIALNHGGGGSSSCSWDQSDVQTAIKMYQNGVENACYTKAGGCAAGGLAAKCDTDDTCEKYASCFPGSCSSHAYCLWDVYLHYR